MTVHTVHKQFDVMTKPQMMVVNNTVLRNIFIKNMTTINKTKGQSDLANAVPNDPHTAKPS